jgi:hypothetical protein
VIQEERRQAAVELILERSREADPMTLGERYEDSNQADWDAIEELMRTATVEVSWPGPAVHQTDVFPGDVPHDVLHAAAEATYLAAYRSDQPEDIVDFASLAPLQQAAWAAKARPAATAAWREAQVRRDMQADPARQRRMRAEALHEAVTLTVAGPGWGNNAADLMCLLNLARHLTAWVETGDNDSAICTATVSWDVRQGPDIDELRQALACVSRGAIRIHDVPTGTDDYAIVLADHHLTDAEVKTAWEAGR